MLTTETIVKELQVSNHFRQEDFRFENISYTEYEITIMTMSNNIDVTKHSFIQTCICVVS